jgi:hypothetical protein
MLSYFTGGEEDSEDIVEKRVRVLRLHVETLTRQAEVREAELAAAKVKLKGFEAQQSEAAPREKKLFNRLEKLQAELKLAREHRAAEESRAADLAAHLEQIVDAAKGENETPGTKILLKVTNEQLDVTQKALQQALFRASDAERQASDASAEAKRAQDLLEQAEQREAALDQRLTKLVDKCSQASTLQLPPMSKGKDLAEQHHILQLSYRHLQSEVRLKMAALEGLAHQRDELRSLVDQRLPAQQEHHRKLRAELAQQKQEAHEQITAMRESLEQHLEHLDGMRRGSISQGGEEQNNLGPVARGLLVRSRVSAAVRMGALRAAGRRAAAAAACAEQRKAELKAQAEAAAMAAEDARRSAEQRVKGLETEIGLLRRELDAAVSGSDAIRMAKQELVTAQEGLLSQMRALQGSLDASEEELHRVQAERHSLREQLDEGASREHELAEQLAREQRAKQASVEELHELRRAMPGTDLEQRLHEARDAAAAARSEAAALQMQLEQAKSARDTAARREAEAQQQLRRAEERASQATRQLQAASTHSTAHQSQALTQSGRELEAVRRTAGLENECARLRHELNEQRQVVQRQGLQAQPAAMQGSAMFASPAGFHSPAAPNMASMASMRVAADEAAQLRQHLLQAQQREAALAEQLRQTQMLQHSGGSEHLEHLANSYRAKAEQLAQQLADERNVAATQGELWKEQMQALRTRSKADRENAQQLEEQLRAVLNGDHSTPRLRASAEGRGTPSTRTPEPGPGDEPLIFGGARARPGGSRGSIPIPIPIIPMSKDTVKKEVTKVLGVVDKKVDGVLDKVADKMDGVLDNAMVRMDSIVGRFQAARSSFTGYDQPRSLLD